MDGVPRRERRWGAGVTERCHENKRLLMGGDSMEEGTENDPELVETCGAVEDIISVKNYQQSLGLEG